MYKYRLVNRRTGQVLAEWNETPPFVSVSVKERTRRPYISRQVLGFEVAGYLLNEDEVVETSVRSGCLILIGLSVGLSTLGLFCWWMV